MKDVINQTWLNNNKKIETTKYLYEKAKGVT